LLSSMCIYLDKSGIAQSWTEASRGDRISPKHFIIQRSDKCNTIFCGLILKAHTYHTPVG
jgi:hypothetical protein